MSEGTGFQSGDTVTVDGSHVDATVLNPYGISLEMRAHAAGRVDVRVIRPDAQAQASVPGGFSYVANPRPVTSELLFMAYACRSLTAALAHARASKS